jgi:hypothetical protein
MSWLKRVIARLLTIQTQPLVVLVQPMPTAGLAPQTPTTKAGNKRSVATTKRQRQLSPAQQASQKKPKVAKSTTAVSKDSSKKPKPVQTARSRTTAGNSTQKTARQTPRVVSQAPKRKA